MDHLIKNAIFIELKADKKSLESDLRLLKEKNPKSKVFTKNYFDNDLKRREILYELIDLASKDEILENRGKGKKNEPVKLETYDEIEAEIIRLEEFIEAGNLVDEEKSKVEHDLEGLYVRLEKMASGKNEKTTEENEKLKDKVEELEEENEEVKLENEELIEKVEDLEDKLDEEKKNISEDPQNPKSNKKKKNTRK